MTDLDADLAARRADFRKGAMAAFVASEDWVPARVDWSGEIVTFAEAPDGRRATFAYSHQQKKWLPLGAVDPDAIVSIKLLTIAARDLADAQAVFARLQHETAKTLAAEGLSSRQIGACLGISHERAAQLTSGRTGHESRKPAKRSTRAKVSR